MPKCSFTWFRQAVLDALPLQLVLKARSARFNQVVISRAVRRGLVRVKRGKYLHHHHHKQKRRNTKETKKRDKKKASRSRKKGAGVFSQKILHTPSTLKSRRLSLHDLQVDLSGRRYIPDLYDLQQCYKNSSQRCWVGVRWPVLTPRMQIFQGVFTDKTPHLCDLRASSSSCCMLLGGRYFLGWICTIQILRSRSYSSCFATDHVTDHPHQLI